MKVFQTTREIDRMPFYVLSAGTEAVLFHEDDQKIMLDMKTEGDSRLAGYVLFTYAKAGPYDELTLPYEEFHRDWEEKLI